MATALFSDCVAVQFNGCQDFFKLKREVPEFQERVMQTRPIRHGICESFLLRLPGARAGRVRVHPGDWIVYRESTDQIVVIPDYVYRFLTL